MYFDQTMASTGLSRCAGKLKDTFTARKALNRVIEGGHVGGKSGI